MVHVYINIKITFLLSLARTMDSMTDDGKRKLIECKIASSKMVSDKKRYAAYLPKVYIS